MKKLPRQFHTESAVGNRACRSMDREEPPRFPLRAFAPHGGMRLGPVGIRRAPLGADRGSLFCRLPGARAALRPALSALLAWTVLLQLAAPAPAASNAGSSATVTFTESDEKPVPPVDPDRPGGGGSSGGGSWFPDFTLEIPEEEVPAIHRPEPEESGAENNTNPPTVPPHPPPQPWAPGATGAGGRLTINYVTPLAFVVALEGNTYALSDPRPNLQLSDRRGTGSGWKVTAVAGPLTDQRQREHRALLRFTGGTLNTTNLLVDPPHAERLVELPADNATERRVLTADPNTGMGTWILRWYPQNGAENDVQLELLARPDSDARLQGSVLWRLHDAP